MVGYILISVKFRDYFERTQDSTTGRVVFREKYRVFP
jgi:hypothetical protein